MKKIILSMFLLLGALFLVGCKSSEVDLESKESVFAISAVTGVNETINNITEENPVIDENEKIPVEESNDDNVNEGENVDLPNEDQDNLEFVLNLINKELLKVEEKESDKTDYTNLLEITFNNETYKFYFNEILIEEEIEDDEIEKEYEIKGIIIYNEEEFSVVGNKEIEIEEDEEDFEIELLICLDKDNYTKVKYETETESDEYEKKYKIETYENSNKINEFEFEFEIEENKLKVDVEFKSKDKNVWYKIRGNNKNSQANVIYHSHENGVKTKQIFKVRVIIEDNNVRFEYLK